MKDEKLFEEETLIEIGLRCARLREKAGKEKQRNVSQREFARVLGVPHSAISMIKSGKKGMTMKELCAYQKACKVSFDYLLGRIETPSLKVDDMTINETLGLNEVAIRNLYLAWAHAKADKKGGCARCRHVRVAAPLKAPAQSGSARMDAGRRGTPQAVTPVTGNKFKNLYTAIRRAKSEKSSRR